MKIITNSLSSVFQMKYKSQGVKSFCVNGNSAHSCGRISAKVLLACHLFVVATLGNLLALPGNVLADTKGDSMSDSVDISKLSTGKDQSPTVVDGKPIPRFVLASSSSDSMPQLSSNTIIGQWLLEVKKKNVHVYIMVRFNADGSVDKVDTSDFGHAKNPSGGDYHQIDKDTPSMGFWYRVNAGKGDEIRAVMYYFEHDTDSGMAEEIRATVLSNLKVDGNNIKGYIHIATAELTGSPAEVMKHFSQNIHKHDAKVETSEDNHDFRAPLNGVRITSRY